MDKKIYDTYVRILKEELVPALGCTEPIALAYASAKAGETEGTNLVEPVFQVLKMQMAVSVEDLIRRLNNYNRPVVFLGDGVPVYSEMLSEGLKVPYSFAPSYMNRQRAAVVGALGIRYFKAGKFETAAEHKPDYLRVSQAERERAEREKNAKTTVRRMTMEDAAAVAEIFRETETAAVSGLSPEELEQLKGLLDRLWRSMETHRMQHDSGEEKNEIQ